MSDILVGVDGSPAGDAALRWALAHAVVTGHHVTALHVWQPPADIGPAGLYEPTLGEAELAAQARAVLDAALARTTAHLADPTRLVTAVVAAGPAALVLETWARAAALLVLGRSNAPLLTRAIAGSTLSGALHHVRCPVVVVPATAGVHAGLDTGRVVVGVADGQASEGALTWAAATATALRRPLVTVFVRHPHAVQHSGDWRPVEDFDDVALKHLREVASDAAPHLAVPLVADVLVGHPAEELVRYTTADDLLVVGSRGRGQLAGWFLGSTSNRVVHEAHCPVVVVREPDEDEVSDRPGS